MNEAPGATPGGTAGCEVADLFRLLSKAHMLETLHVLIRHSDGPLRFVDLQQKLGISPNTLSERLKALVATGFLTRTAYNEIPPRVDYEATQKARDLCGVFDALDAWAGRHDLYPAPRQVAQ